MGARTSGGDRELGATHPADLALVKEKVDNVPAVLCTGISAARAAPTQRMLDRAGTSSEFRRADERRTLPPSRTGLPDPEARVDAGRITAQEFEKILWDSTIEFDGRYWALAPTRAAGTSTTGNRGWRPSRPWPGALPSRPRKRRPSCVRPSWGVFLLSATGRWPRECCAYSSSPSSATSSSSAFGGRSTPGAVGMLPVPRSPLSSGSFSWEPSGWVSARGASADDQRSTHQLSVMVSGAVTPRLACLEESLRPLLRSCASPSSTYHGGTTGDER